MPRLRNIFLTWFSALLAFALTSKVKAQESNLHIDTEAGVRFSLPFPVYQKKSALQIENLIRDAVPGEWTKAVDYTSALYSDNSDAFIVVWRQPINELPTRYQFKRLKFFAPLRSSVRVSEVAVFEDRAAATYTLDLPQGVRAKVALLLTKSDNVFIGLYGKTEKDLAGFPAMFSSIEIDPKRRVQWTDLPSGLKPLWSGLILAIGFLVGFIVYLLAAHAIGKEQKEKADAKKSGEFSSPDKHLSKSRHIPKGF
jgi:hypothetical protein